MERTLVASYPKAPPASHHRLLSPDVVKVSAWRTNKSRVLTLQSSQQRRRLTLSSNSTPRIVCLFGGGKGKGKEGGDLTGKDAAIKALEQAFGGKRSQFSKWVETQKIEADMGGNDIGGDDGGDGWSGGRGGSDDYDEEDKPEDVLQTIIAFSAFIFMYLWMCFREDMARGYRAVRRWFRDNNALDWLIYYFEVFKYNARIFLFGREEDNKDEPEFYTLPEFFGVLRLFWDRILNDEEEQIKDCKEFESLLKDLLEYKRHGRN